MHLDSQRFDPYKQRWIFVPVLVRFGRTLNSAFDNNIIITECVWDNASIYYAVAH